MVTEKQKQIYNLFSTTSRKFRNKPYKFRKKWDGFEQKEEYLFVQKLEKIFDKYPQFFNEKYFLAPYKLHSIDEDSYFPLKFYASQKGITCCTTYLNLLKDQKPEEQKEFIKETFQFIAKFCKEKNLKTLGDYVNYKSLVQNNCLKHLKEHRICWYTVFFINGFFDLLYKMPKDEFEMYYGTRIDLQEIRNVIYSNTDMVEFIEKCRRKTELYLISDNK